MSGPLLPVSSNETRPATPGSEKRDWLKRDEIIDLFDERLDKKFVPIATALDRNSDALQGIVMQSTLMLGDGKLIEGEVPKVLKGLSTLQAEVEDLHSVVVEHHNVADKRFESLETGQATLESKVDELSKRRFLIVHVCITTTDWLMEKNPRTGQAHWERFMLFITLLGLVGVAVKPLFPSGHVSDFINWVLALGGKKP